MSDKPSEQGKPASTSISGNSNKLSKNGSTENRPSRSAQRSASKDSVKSRDPSNCTSPTNGTKKLPPIKAPVGLAKGPDLKNVRSKIGSLQNVKHKPTQGEKKVITQKLEWQAKPKIGSLDYVKHKPAGGEVKIENKKLEWKAKPKVGSLDNVKHKPGGGQINIFDEKYTSRSSTGGRSPSECRSISPSSTTNSVKSMSNTPTGGRSPLPSSSSLKGTGDKENKPIGVSDAKSSLEQASGNEAKTGALISSSEAKNGNKTENDNNNNNNDSGKSISSNVSPQPVNG